MDGVTLGALGLLAMAYSGLVLNALANALRRQMPPRRAALVAFGLSAVVHSATALALPEQHILTGLALWGVPHLLWLPLLLASARRIKG